MRTTTHVAALIAALMLAGCSEILADFTFYSLDAGQGPHDAGADSGPRDSSVPDAGVDGGRDAGTDASVALDAALPDAALDGGPVLLPDLTVTIERASRVSGQVRIEYTVRNVGAAPSGPYRIDLWADRGGWFGSPPSAGDVGVFSMKPSLAAGASQSFSDDIPSVVIELPAAWAIVDTLNGIPEFDEVNNVSLGSAWSHTPLLYTGTQARAVDETIPDADAVTCVRSTMTLGSSWDSVPSSGIALSVSVTHERTADLSIEIIAPGGQRRQLFLNHGGDGDHLIATTFRDEATQSITAGSPPYAAEYRAVGMWTPPLGSTLSGTWTLRVCDTRPAHTGVLNQWALSYAVAE